MNASPRILCALLLGLILSPTGATGQDPLATPLDQETLTLLANEISGQMAYNTLVRIAGAPWLRDPEEFTGTFQESRALYDLVRGYGVETVRLEQWDRGSTFTYPTDGELWILEPEPRLVARLGADAALIASGSQSGEVSGSLVYLPPLSADEVRELGDTYAGKIALMWSHPRGDVAEALDGIGVQGVIAFNARERYLDPNQVVYSRGSYGGEHLRMGMTVSWRQWSELLEDVERGIPIVVRLTATIEEYPDRYETVFAWIPGTEPDAPGVIA